MDIRQCIMTNSLCYIEAGRVPQHFGIVVHSTGVNQPRISRYVQPSDDDPNKDAILADIGINRYHNDWNHPPANPKPSDRKGVHCFIGNNAAGEVVCYQVLPWDNIAWGVYKGNKGSYNDNPPYLQFEICEDGLTDEVYFTQCMETAQELCAYLCENFGIPVENIVSHYEAYQQGYGNAHVDPSNWMAKFGKDMNWFRSEVQKLMGQKVKVGDIVRLKPGAHAYTANGIDRGYGFSSWVYDSDLIVGEINATVAHISTDMTLESYTGWAALTDLTKVEEPDDDLPPDDVPVDDGAYFYFPQLGDEDEGEEWAVMLLQERLDCLGYPGNKYRLTIDGIYGDETIKAVNRFKEDHVLEADGIVDAATWDALLHEKGV